MSNKISLPIVTRSIFSNSKLSLSHFHRFLNHHDFILWPSFRLSYPEIQSGPVTSDLVFTTTTMTTNCHMTHKIVPVVSDDDHKRHHVVKKPSPRDESLPLSPSKSLTSFTKHSGSCTKSHSDSTSKTPHSSYKKHPHSPTKHPHSPTKHPHSSTKHPPLQPSSSGATSEDFSNVHSSPKIKSPTKHHHPSGNHHKHYHHHHHHHHKHHSKNDGETEATNSEHAAGGSVTPASERGKSSSGKNETIFRVMQPTSPPKFLLAYVPKVRKYALDLISYALR